MKERENTTMNMSSSIGNGIRRFARIIGVCLLVFSMLLALAGCKKIARHQNSLDFKKENLMKPDDFSFSITFNTHGTSFYDSKSGKLIKETDAKDLRKYTTYVILSEEEMDTIYRFLFSDIDLFSYPVDFDPFNAPGSETNFMSSPSECLELLVTADGVTKRYAMELAFGSLDECFNESAAAFLNAIRNVENFLEELPEWKALPDYDRLFM